MQITAGNRGETEGLAHLDAILPPPYWAPNPRKRKPKSASNSFLIRYASAGRTSAGLLRPVSPQLLDEYLHIGV